MGFVYFWFSFEPFWFKRERPCENKKKQPQESLVSSGHRQILPKFQGKATSTEELKDKGSHQVEEKGQNKNENQAKEEKEGET